MPWGRVDDTYYDHPKLEQLEGVHEWPDRLVAAGLNSLAWSWSNRFLTDGRIPRATVLKLGGTIELAELLVSVGLWESHGTGFQIHDFLVYNDSRAAVLARREKEAARKAAWRAGQQPKKRPAGTDTGTPSVTDTNVPPSVPPSVPTGQENVSRRLSRRPSRDSTRARIPTRPDPTDSDSLPNPSRRREGRRRGATNGRTYDDLVRRDVDERDDSTTADLSFEPIEAGR